ALAQGRRDEHWVATWAPALVARAAPGAGAPAGPGRGAPAAQTPRGGGGGREGTVQPAPAAGAPGPTAAGRGAAAPAGPGARGGGRGGGRGGAPVAVNNRTIRQIVRTTLGGERVRVVLSNAFGTAPLQVGAAHAALRECATGRTGCVRASETA